MYKNIHYNLCKDNKKCPHLLKSEDIFQNGELNGAKYSALAPYVVDCTPIIDFKALISTTSVISVLPVRLNCTLGVAVDVSM